MLAWLCWLFYWNRQHNQFTFSFLTCLGWIQLKWLSEIMPYPGLAMGKFYKKHQPTVPVLKGQRMRSGWSWKRGHIHISDIAKRKRNQIIRKPQKCWTELSTYIANSIMSIFGIMMDWWCFEKYIFIIFCPLKCHTILNIVQNPFFSPYKMFMVHCNAKYIQDLSSEKPTLQLDSET